MKLVGKITKYEEIIQHLQRLSESLIYVRFYTKESDYLQKGLLEIESNDSCDLLTFTPPPSIIPQSPVLKCQYTFENNVFVFHTQSINMDDTQVSLEMPNSIQQYDRRKFTRVHPSKTEPVYIRFIIPSKTILRMPVWDLSVGGCSVLIPRISDFFNVEKAFDAIIEIPNGDKLRTRAVVRGLYSFLNIARIGFSFQKLTEHGEKDVQAYILERQRERKDETREKKKATITKVCIVETDADKTSFSFLQEDYNIKVVSHLDAVGKLRQHPPEIILLNMNQSGAILVLRTVSKDKLLKDLPLILLGKKSSKVKQRSGVIVSIGLPYKPQYLIKAMAELIEKVRLAKETENSYWQYFSGKGKTVAIVDPRKNLKKSLFKPLKDFEFNLFWIRDDKGIAAQLTAARPDVILLDENTGHVDAASLCRMINLSKSIKGIPKIRLMPKKEMPQSLFIESDGVYYLYKQFDARQLVTSVFKTLGVDM
jgi:response regulator RpfG family c-di-GMP phosphodiesterase